ncbi:MAG: hypothetical protein GOMPHAMPRED_005650 [Gomphillus americanus]|uniref:proline--tRNA ligase n=1 Tax=Gomphillus americanus TaxID=1940652 RepID=A0A8H3IJK3_9LECA|nr:MAG: hypothetical protein GOMPHAMPRED_005650 [Gomphillus americanus]
MYWIRPRPWRSSLFREWTQQDRQVHSEAFHRLSRFWTSTGAGTDNAAAQSDSNALLVKAGFIRQSYAGVFQFLPLGLRVQDKIERLIDKHMRNLGASKVSLSSLSSEELWRKSGRLQQGRSELFSLEDRKGSRFLLSPTHEEEITSLMRSLVHSYKDLPVRLYQVTRKYRDEPRPRQGLLRTREFLMKDLYTFDSSQEAALETYEIVRQAYRAFFEELKLPFIVAEADSGNIGGDLSHEYHIASEKGEDRVYSCDNCKVAFNEEILSTGKNLTKDQDTCSCPRCSKMMTCQTTIELGHTFYLGTKYSKALDATIAVQDQGVDLENVRPIEMGCHGIGISRLIAGVANLYTDSKGLGWSRAIAPFELIIMQNGTTSGVASELAAFVTGSSKVDTMVDDRPKSLVWKMKDADLIGYPIIAILGKAWEKDGKVEIQCRRLGYKQDVIWGDIPGLVTQLLDKY